MKKKTSKPNHGIEAAEPRLLFSAGLEGVLATHDLGIPSTGVEQAAIEQSVDRATVDKASTPAVESGVELIFVDSDTPEYQALLSDLLTYPDDTTYQVFELDNSRDGIAQISDILSGYDNVSAVHILSHGTEGAIDLGGSQLDAGTLAANADTIRGWSNAFAESGDLLIYGCNLAATAEGKILVNSLSTLTGADVAASDDLTGNAALGGDWDLEYRRGDIETGIAVSAEAQDSWAQLLDVESFQEGVGGYTYTVDTYLDFNQQNADNSTGTKLITHATDSQGLLRFDNVFGAGPGQVESGSTINSATLTLEIGSGNEGDPGSSLFLHQMLTTWADTDTWNSTGGILTDDVEAASVAAGSAAADVAGTIVIDITSLVQAWSDGTANFGVLLATDSITSIQLWSSEGTTAPLLTVDYTVAADTTAPSQVNNTGSTVAEGGTDTITNLELRYDDDLQPATSVTYTVTTSPANGWLELTGNPGVTISSFTQDDLDNNRVIYTHNGGETSTDSFTFDVDDGQGNTLAGQSFVLTVTSINDAPSFAIGDGAVTTDFGSRRRYRQQRCRAGRRQDPGSGS